jgi:hypothetical protein
MKGLEEGCVCRFDAYRHKKRERERRRYAEDPAYREKARKRARRWLANPANREKERERTLKWYYDKKRGEMFLDFLKVGKVLREMGGT